jgi:hypothetical protein
MEQFSIWVDIENNKLKSIYAYSQDYPVDWMEWNYNYDKCKPEFIAEIVISDELKGLLLKSTLVDAVMKYHQTIKSDSMVDAIATVLDIVNNHVLTLDFTAKLKAKEIELLNKQSRELLEKANKLKGVIE